MCETCGCGDTNELKIHDRQHSHDHDHDHNHSHDHTHENDHDHSHSHSHESVLFTHSHDHGAKKVISLNVDILSDNNRLAQPPAAQQMLVKMSSQSFLKMLVHRRLQ